MCVNSASTVLRGAGDNGDGEDENDQARSSRVRQGVNKRLVVNVSLSLKKPVYSTFADFVRAGELKCLSKVKAAVTPSERIISKLTQSTRLSFLLEAESRVTIAAL